MNPWEGVSWSEGMRIGWLLLWRGFLISFGIGFVVGFVGGLLRAPRPIYFGLALVLGAIITWPIIVSQMLRKKFHGFTITIVRGRTPSAMGSSSI
jgi:xanthosine utilization system XapX-like protein